MVTQLIALTMAVAGAMLLGLAAAPNELRPEGIEGETNTQFRTGVVLEPKEAIRQLRTVETESPRAYVEGVTSIVHRSVAHQRPPREAHSSYETRVPLSENYILWAFSYLPGKFGEVFRSYNYQTYERAFERGFGECAQFAYALRDFLLRNGIEARHTSLDGHVILEVKVRGERFVADPDYDVVVPHSLDEIRSQLAIVRSYYQQAAPLNDHVDREDTVLDYIEGLYEPPYATFDPTDYRFRSIEKLSYRAMWMLPAVLFTSAWLLLH